MYTLLAVTFCENQVYIVYTLLTVAFCENQFPAGNLADFLLEIGFRRMLQLAARTQFPVQLIHKNWGSVAKEMLRESEFCLWVYYSGKYIIQLPMSMVTILEFPKLCVHTYNH